MTRLAELQPVKESGPYWRLSLILLLLCGLGLWNGVERIGSNAAKQAPFFTEIEQLAPAIPRDYQRIGKRNQEPATDADADNEFGWPVTTTGILDVALRPLRQSALHYLSIQLPRTTSYQPHAPRAPPFGLVPV